MTTLSIAIGDYPHTARLKDGTVPVEGYDVDFIDVGERLGPPHFRRMTRNLEFDGCEMAVTTYLSAREWHKAFTAIPVFLVREFHQRALAVNTNAGITTPKDLEGKRVGMRAYTQTTVVWAKAVLSEQYGVDLDKITWVVADEEHVKEFVHPDNVEVMIGADLSAMLSSGELAGGIGLARAGAENVAPLITDRKEREREWAAKGLYPINHGFVIKDELIAADPGLASALYRALSKSKALFLEDLAAGRVEGERAHELAERRELVGPDPIPYGIEANRVALEALVRFATEQHILSNAVAIEELFVPGAES